MRLAMVREPGHPHYYVSVAARYVSACINSKQSLERYTDSDIERLIESLKTVTEFIREYQIKVWKEELSRAAKIYKETGAWPDKIQKDIDKARGWHDADDKKRNVTPLQRRNRKRA